MVLPILVFPKHGRAHRMTRPASPPRYGLPTAERQEERLGAQFRRLVADLKHVSMQDAATGGAPGKVLVVETAGSEQAFAEAARTLAKKVQGLQWLDDWAANSVPPDDDFFVEADDEERTDKSVALRLYLISANHQGLEGLLRRWEQWQTSPDHTLPTPYGALADFFQCIRALRWWGHKDRMQETGLLEAWTEDLKADPERAVRCEIEAWSSGKISGDVPFRTAVRAAVHAVGGTVIDDKLMPEVHYNGVLAAIPALRRNCSPPIRRTCSAAAKQSCSTALWGSRLARRGGTQTNLARWK
jgi:hypothetical protein